MRDPWNRPSPATAPSLPDQAGVEAIPIRDRPEEVAGPIVEAVEPRSRRSTEPADLGRHRATAAPAADDDSSGIARATDRQRQGDHPGRDRSRRSSASTLDTVRREFGWAYGSYWTVDPAQKALVFALESGEVDAEFDRVTRSARFREGEGLNGRAWQRRDLVLVDDLADLADCCRAPIARRSGVRSAVCLPIIQDDERHRHDGLLRHRRRWTSPDDRLDVLRALARLASDKITAARPSSAS